MKSLPTISVQPSVMLWARQTIGLTAHDVAIRLKRPISDIEAWEAGEASPTYSQLEKLAYDVYKRPLALFFMPSPPNEDAPQQEFRSLPDTDLQSLEPDTRLRIRSAHAYQLALKEIYSRQNPVNSKIWQQIVLNLQTPVTKQSDIIRTFLGVSLEEQFSWRDTTRALKEWREAIETGGVFVFKWTFKQKDISGLSLLDSEFPLIYLNNSNAPTRQVFSLFHELAHILLGTNGICKDDPRNVGALPRQIRYVEQFCNAIAAEILVSNSDFVIKTKPLGPNLDDMYITQLVERLFFANCWNKTVYLLWRTIKKW